MAKKFKGFNNQQTHQLLKEMGFTGPAQKDEMDAFIASSPSAGSMLGRYTDIARQRVEGGPLAQTGMADGGEVDYSTYYDDKGGIQNLELDKFNQANQAASTQQPQQAQQKLSPQDILSMAVGKTESKLEYDFNKDGKISAQDALLYAKQLKAQEDQAAEQAKVDQEKQTEIDSLNARLRELQGLPKNVNITQPISSYKKGPTDEVVPMEKTQADLGTTAGSFLSGVMADSDTALGDTTTRPTGDLLGMPEGFTGPPAGSMVTQALVDYYNPTTKQTWSASTGGYTPPEGWIKGKPDNPDDYKYWTASDKTLPVQPFEKPIVQQPDVDPVLEARKAAMKGQDKSEQILKMAVGLEEPDLQYDLNKDGKITTQDALTYLQESKAYDEARPAAGTKTIVKGSAAKGPTPAATNLDAAQQEYATAQQTLVDAQLAVSNLVEPEATPFDLDTADVIKSEYSSAIAEDKYGIKIRNGDFTDKAELELMLLSGSLPQDPTKYEGEGTDKEPKAFAATDGADKGWTFTYDNGQTITLHRDSKETAIDDFGKLAGLLNDFKATDTYQNNLTEEQKGYKDKKEAIDKAYEDAELANTQAQAKVSTAQKQFETTDIPSTSEALGKAISDPSSLVTKQQVAGIEAQDDQFIKEGTGQLDAAERFQTKLGKATLAKEVVNNGAATYEAVLAQDKVKAALAEFAAQTGTPSADAISKAETMTPEELAQLNLDPATADFIRDIPEIKRKIMDGELPEGFAAFDEYVKVRGAQFEGEVEQARVVNFEDKPPEAKPQVDYNLDPTAIALAEATKVEQAAQFAEIASAPEKQSKYVPNFTGEERDVTDKEIIDVNKIINSPEIIVVGETIEALTGDAVAKAASTTFTQALEAKAITGTVSANSTVAGQLEKLMSSFDDGTPAWAAGALRSVNATMLARGLGGSSMAAAAMVQAAMETTLPIAQADASIFQAMDMENVRNAQAVSLANAAAAQNFDLANLSNRQAANLQKSLGNTNLQMQNLSNAQEAVLAQAQLKASLRGQVLGVKENVSIANAARYAQVNDINLTNTQQSSILRSSQALEVDMANLSNRQQTALSNLQVKAAMMGQDLTNEQQTAVLTTTQAFESKLAEATRKQQAFIQDAASIAAMEGQSLSNSQQTQLFNVGNVVAERGLNLNNEQQTTLFNSTNKMTMDVEDLSNRQQAVLAEAQIEAAMKGQELTNDQQIRIIKTERIAEIANQQFSADTARVMRTSELANTVDLSNLSNRNAKVMADAAAMSQVDVTNLNNRQQAAQQKASAFLEMDFANLSNEQQMEMFKAQSTTQTILSDQAAENSAAQFNAESINQNTQFYDGLNAQIDMHNTAQQNAMEQFNVGEENAMTKFQGEIDNQRDQFNASNELIVAQANTQWRQSIATTNTAAINQANMNDAMAANNLTTQGINELWQQERDLMDYAVQVSEKALDRDHEIAKAKLSADGQVASAKGKAAGTFVSTLLTAALGDGSGVGFLRS